MSDEAASRGIRIDAPALSEALGVDVVPTVAVERKGIRELCTSLKRVRRSRFLPRYDEAIESALAEVEPLLPARGLDRRSVALMVLVGDDSMRETLAALTEGDRVRLEGVRRRLAARYPESLRFVISRQRLGTVDRLHDAVVSHGARSATSSFGRRLGHASTHPLLGLPVLALVLFACYEFVGVLGAKVAVDFLENKVFYERLVPWLDALVRLLVPWRGAQEFLVGPPGVPFREHGGLLVGQYGIFSMGLSYGMAIVLPIVTTFFIAFSVLEDSGYLPRLAVMVNKLFRRMGLNGKAVLPMVLGLGCDTMGRTALPFNPMRLKSLFTITARRGR